MIRKTTRRPKPIEVDHPIVLFRHLMKEHVKSGTSSEKASNSAAMILHGSVAAYTNMQAQGLIRVRPYTPFDPEEVKAISDLSHENSAKQASLKGRRREPRKTAQKEGRPKTKTVDDLKDLIPKVAAKTVLPEKARAKIMADPIFKPGDLDSIIFISNPKEVDGLSDETVIGWAIREDIDPAKIRDAKKYNNTTALKEHLRWWLDNKF